MGSLLKRVRNRVNNMKSSESNRNVFIINEGNKNYLDATKYGKVIPVTRGFVSLASDRIPEIEKRIDRILDKSDKDDYVLLYGPHLLVVIFCRKWLQKHPYMRTLSWDRNSYKEIEILA